ncbi:MAG: aminomethyl-transferring glycine dehydrogenase subunit GcvPB, partial [candidate division WOR-3 bacterium]|nr:aminomethyl-transferring glycine dehydrogenase subunit GcvPB [candidate division WOR-3 bacterium]
MINEKLLFAYSKRGRRAWSLPELDVPEVELADLFGTDYRADNRLPEIAEVDLIRHFTRLSILNHHVDKGFYPLGSCTMKYNPKVNEEAARLPSFTQTHPYQPVDTVQGNLALMYALQSYLQELSGFAAVSLQPAAGAQGELAGILVMRAYHLARGDA